MVNIYYNTDFTWSNEMKLILNKILFVFFLINVRATSTRNTIDINNLYTHLAVFNLNSFWHKSNLFSFGNNFFSIVNCLGLNLIKPLYVRIKIEFFKFLLYLHYYKHQKKYYDFTINSAYMENSLKFLARIFFTDFKAISV